MSGIFIETSQFPEDVTIMELKNKESKLQRSKDKIFVEGKHTLMGKYAEEAEGERPAWDNQVQFLLACISFAVGLGNVWRFPYLAQTYGGGAFLIPYLIMLVIEGIPLFLIELAVGQRIRQGAIGAWNKFHPYLGGIGIGSMIVSFMVLIYYNMIVAWCIWYLCHSFQYPLPYSYCPLNDNKTGYVLECENSSFTEYFWYRTTLNITTSIEDTGGEIWWLVICLLLAWIIVWISTFKGIETSGKVMYFTATFPYLILTIFLIRGLTLPGASNGVSYLFTPDTEVLADPSVWLAAATQIFFSLSLAFGGVIAFASYNPVKQDCQRDALIISVTNSFTSIYASIVIFAILGFRANEKYEECLDGNIEILENNYNLPEGTINYSNYDEKLNNLTNNGTTGPNTTICDLNQILSEASQGTGLAFIVFTEGIINMPGSPFWSVLFFLMLLSLGLGSMFGTIEGVVTPVCDLGLPPKYKPILSATISIAAFLIGLMFTCGSGNYWLDIFNDYAGSVPLLVIAFFEIITVSWFYGLDNFNEDIAWMIGPPKSIPGWILFYYFRICWVFISPVALLVVMIAFIYQTATTEITYQVWMGDGSMNEAFYPWYALMVIYVLILVPCIPIPIVWLYRFLRKLIIRKRIDENYKLVGILEDKEWTWKKYVQSLVFWRPTQVNHDNSPNEEHSSDA